MGKDEMGKRKKYVTMLQVHTCYSAHSLVLEMYGM